MGVWTRKKAIEMTGSGNQITARSAIFSLLLMCIPVVGSTVIQTNVLSAHIDAVKEDQQETKRKLENVDEDIKNLYQMHWKHSSNQTIHLSK
jgi:hypothetical protein